MGTPLHNMRPLPAVRHSSTAQRDGLLSHRHPSDRGQISIKFQKHDGISRQFICYLEPPNLILNLLSAIRGFLEWSNVKSSLGRS